jgi:hypothetical protein
MVTKVVQDLTRRRKVIAAQVANLQAEASKIDAAIQALSSGTKPATKDKAAAAAPVKTAVAKRKPKISAAGIERIRAAQRKRWALIKKQRAQAS